MRDDILILLVSILFIYLSIYQFKYKIAVFSLPTLNQLLVLEMKLYELIT